MKVLIIGSGAREHAFAWKIAEDAAANSANNANNANNIEVIAAPGNAGMAMVGDTYAVDVEDPHAIVALAQQQNVDLVIIGPEAPLVAGAVDALQAAGIQAFGPSKAAAQLEASKIFAKEFMTRHGVPTAGFRVFDDPDAASAYVREANRPLVIKADGLAAGKGVVVATNTEEALEAINRIMRARAFGSAGDRVLIEECLVGEEVSYHIVSDGHTSVALAPAQDHKRAFDGDRGPNTGGMGAYSPPPIFTADIETKVQQRIIAPTLQGMASENMPFAGALFVGLMIVDGEPLVLEYNVRFGDPETECIMARWRGPVLPLFLGAARGDLDGLQASWRAPAALCVVLASGGYPGAYTKGKQISGIRTKTNTDAHTVVFHAGTRACANNEHNEHVVTSGGRVLAVTAIGDNVAEASERAYAVADTIDFEGKMMRRDIGWRAQT